jgi:ABC-type nitrate/sulfonate/bicarbonate transport system permease component
MRYSQGLRRYQNQKHRPQTYLVLIASFFALAFLIFISRANTLDLASALVDSTIRVTLAYLITLPIAVAVVLAITRVQKVEDFVVPILDVSQSLPSFALLPFLLVLTGQGTITIVIVLALEMVWPILFTTLSGLKTLHEDLGEAATVFGARGIKRLRYFSIPSILPAIITGSILGWGEGWEAIVGAEIIVGKNGIGAFIGKANDTNKQIFVFSIVILMLFIFILNKLIWLPLLKRVTKYQT